MLHVLTKESSKRHLIMPFEAVYFNRESCSIHIIYLSTLDDKATNIGLCSTALEMTYHSNSNPQNDRLPI